MRRLSIALIVSTVTLTRIVSAAALPRELPVPTPPPPLSWTGLCVGRQWWLGRRRSVGKLCVRPQYQRRMFRLVFLRLAAAHVHLQPIRRSRRFWRHQAG